MQAWLLLAAMFFVTESSDAHVLDVPYRTQLDGSSYAQANCGPTSLSMALAYYGVDASTWDLRVSAMKAQHSWVTDEGGYSDRYGVFVYNLATVAQQLGFHAQGLWDREGGRIDRLHQWSAADLRREVLHDHPVIVEVQYRSLPAHVGSMAVDDHFIVVRGTLGPDFVYSDPLGHGDQGPDERISESDLTNAMARSSAPRAAFALIKP
jgi:peptidase C39-like protein